MEKDLSLSQLVYPELKTTYRLNITGSTDFYIWKSKLNFVLVDNAVKYVLARPLPDKQADPETHQKFLDDDFTARHIILGSLDDSLFISYEHHETAKSLLDALTSYFTKPSMSKRMALLRRYVDHKMSDDTSAQEHVLKMDSLACELELEGVKVSDELQAVFLMNSLPESWRDVMSGMLMKIDEDEKGLRMEYVSKRVRDTGAWKEFFKARDDDEAKSISGCSNSNKFRGKCYGCGETGHRKADCPYDG